MFSVVGSDEFFPHKKTEPKKHFLSSQWLYDERSSSNEKPLRGCKYVLTFAISPTLILVIQNKQNCLRLTFHTKVRVFVCVCVLSEAMGNWVYRVQSFHFGRCSRQ